jgi:hypothetical protein
VAAFARSANGGTKPNRVIAGQKTYLGRTMHGIRYDEIHDELLLPQQFGQAILVFRGGASGEEAPIRVIQGDATKLLAPDRLEVDPVNNEILVPEDDYVLVFPRQGNGNVTPKRMLFANGTFQEANVDAVHNLLIIGGTMRSEEGRRKAAIMMFDRTAENKAAPRSAITGPGAGGGNRMTIYPPRGLLFAAVRGTTDSDDKSHVAVWSIQDSGDVPPRWTIGGPNGALRQPRGVAIDPQSKTVIVSDKYLNSVLSYSFPEGF